MSPLEQMLHQYPDAYRYFGKHESSQQFEIIVSGDDWTVLREGMCWVLADDQWNGSAEVHWFCPVGANLDDIRKLLAELFKTYEALVGITPTGHPYEKQARILNRAVGAERIKNNFYVLTRERFAEIMASKQ